MSTFPMRHEADVEHQEGALLSRITTTIALLAAVIVAIGAPFGYFYLMLASDEGRLRADANVRSFLISQVVSSDPDMWKFEGHAIDGIISRRFHEEEVDSLAVRDASGAVMYQHGPAKQPWPALTTVRPIYDSGHVVGEIELRHSIRHIFPLTALIALISSIVGLGVFFAVRMFPMRALEQAWQRATHDPLTGLPNRLLLADRIEQAAALCARSDTTFAIHCLDLDHFKEINDTLGHRAGDLLLTQAGERMAQCLRKGDTLARTGGDEFVVLQPDVRTPDDAAASAEKLIHAISRPFDLEGHQVMLTTSVGIALYEKSGQSTTELLQNADNALYRAKSLQRGTLHFFDKGLNERLDARKKAERELRAALATNQFELLYQPQISLPDGAITGVEVLIRWRHPIRGLVDPDEFISLAEETGLIVPIGEWILRTACSQAAKWNDLTLAVNVSPVQFRKGHIAATVREALEESGFPPDRLELEITEGILIADTETTLNTLNEIRKLGVRIVMDDFGTGYSSLGYLRKFPFDKLKLDKSFVRDLGQNPDADAIAHTIIDLARTLKITSNAEGVESQTQLDWLVQQGCGEAQGYWFARPLTYSDVDQFVAAFKPGVTKAEEGGLSSAEASKNAGVVHSALRKSAKSIGG
ncbi:EAL domain-containing protein [Bradyrhizobium sediminis]|uniref:EAL domain-containing protein n=1 Tax=Bradyrhizobium sediminis TaxID=2840469 RepID=A0A975NAE6_9BRAD|nr:EAL domain-containing protein [Bradyrhizobium sediminis]QWG10881.1 EAL domain-containing protein [Bradyrhizobium sediminis]